MKKMTTLLNEASVEIPGYKCVLKSVIKSQIQQLVEQLAVNTDEESVFLTASVSDGTISHLGSETGSEFLKKHEDVKLQFLGFCLKNYYEKKLELQRRETESYIHDAKTSFTSQPSDDGETYTASKCNLPTAFNIADKIKRKSPSYKYHARSPNVRFEPYTSPKLYENEQYIHFQDDIGSHGYHESEFDISSNNWLKEEYGTVKNSDKVDEQPEINKSVHISQGKLCDCPLNEAAYPELSAIEHKPVSSHTYLEKFTKPEVKKFKHIPNLSSCVDKINESCDYENETAPTSCNKSKRAGINNVNEDHSLSSFNIKSGTDMQEGNEHNKLQLKESDESISKPKSIENEKDFPSTSSDFQMSTSFESENDLCLGFPKSENMLENAESLIVKNGQNSNLHSNGSHVSKLRISKSLLRRYEVNNALKMSNARRANKGCNVTHTSGKSSVENVDAEYNDVELQQNRNKDIEIETNNNNAEELVDQCISSEKEDGIACNEKSGDRQSPICVNDSNSESELEIVAIEPGSVFVFKDSFCQPAGIEGVVSSKRESVMKQTRSFRRKKRVNPLQVCHELSAKTNRDHKADRHSREQLIAKFRKSKASPKCIKQKHSTSTFETFTTKAEKSTVPKVCSNELLLVSTAKQSTVRKGLALNEDMETKVKYKYKPDNLNFTKLADSITDTFAELTGSNSSMHSKFISKKKHCPALGFVNVESIRKEVTKNNRRRNISKKKTLVWSDIASNGRSKHLKKESLRKHRKNKRLSEDEVKEESETHIFITDDAEADVDIDAEHSNSRRNSNHVLPSIFTKLSLDTKQKSTGGMASYDSAQTKSDNLLGRIEYDTTLSNDSLKHFNFSTSGRKCDSEDYTICTDKQKNKAIVDSFNEETNVCKTSVNDHAVVIDNRDRLKKKASNIFESISQPNDSTPQQQMCIDSQVHIRKKENVNTLHDQWGSNFNKEYFGGTSTHNIGKNGIISRKKINFKDQIPLQISFDDTQSSGQSIIATDSDNRRSDKILLNHNKDMLSEKYSDVNTESDIPEQRSRYSHDDLKNIDNKHITESSNEPSSCNVDDKEVYFKTKPVSVSLKSLTETISSVTSSLLSSTQFSLFMKSPSLAYSSKSSPSVSSTLSSPHVSQPLSKSMPCSPSNNQSDSSSISNSLSPSKTAELKLDQCVKNNDVRNECQGTQRSFEIEGFREVKVETSTKVSNIVRESAGEGASDDETVIKSEKAQSEASHSHDTSTGLQYTCDTCAKTFQCKSTLSEHISSHTGEIYPYANETRESVTATECAASCEREVKGIYEENAKPKDDLSVLDKPDKSEEFDKVLITTTTLDSKHKAKKRKRVRRKYVMENRSVFRSRKPRRFLCLICGKRFCFKTSLEKHVKWDHITEIHSTCSSCGSHITTTRPNFNLSLGYIDNNPFKRSDSKCSFGINESDCLCNDGGSNKSETALCENCQHLLHSDTDFKSDTDDKKQSEVTASCTKEIRSDTDAKKQSEVTASYAKEVDIDKTKKQTINLMTR